MGGLLADGLGSGERRRGAMRRFGLLALVVMLLSLLPGASGAVISGACCTGAVCTETSQATCGGGGGAYQGDFTTCAQAVCAAVVPSVGSAGLIVLAALLLGAATWLLVRRGRPAPEA
jgi:hypothetical protein